MTWPATHNPNTASPSAANGQTAPAGSQPDLTTASPSISTSATDAVEPTTSNRERAYQAITRTGILSAELYTQLSPFCSQPSRNITLQQIAAYLALAEQMHRRSGEAIAALVEMQAEAFAQQQQQE